MQMTTGIDDEEDQRCAREIRQFHADLLARNLADLRRHLTAAGVPPVVVEAAVCHSEGLQLAQLERDLPLMLRDMALSAGDASLH